MQFLADDLLSEVGKILECLFRVEESHVLESVRVVAKGKRAAVKSVLKSDDKSLQSLRHHDDPLSCLRNAAACVLAADEEKDWTNFRVEVIINNEVTLAKLLAAAVVEVINELIEPQLRLCKGQLVCWVLDWLLEVLDLFAEGGSE